MVLETIIRPKEIRKHPLVMVGLSIVFSSIGIMLAYYTFPQSASLLSLGFVTVMMMPTLHAIFVQEEREEEECPGRTTTFIERHFDLIKIYSFFFIGLIISYSLWYVVSPIEMRNTVFSEQEGVLKNISELRSTITGKAYTSAPQCTNDYWCIFWLIFKNNSMLLFLAIFFSFLLGVGAIFLIAWNASVIAVLIGKDAITTIAANPAGGPLVVLGAYSGGLFNAIGLIPHGMPEILGYLVGAIAGGIISVAITRRKYMCKEFEVIVKDAAFLILIAVALLALGALVESALILGG